MNASQKKVLQYLGEAEASETALVRVLQSQIAMTPRGAYRTALEQHLRQTREHAERVAGRRRELGQGGNPLAAAVGAVESVVGQALALGKTPFDLLRGSGGEEKVLKNAKDACATEALEIATYTAIERLARAVGDDETAKLAASIRADEEKMLERVLREIPKLTDAVVRAEVKGDPSFEVSHDRCARAATRRAKAGTRAKRTARQARKVPGAAQAEGSSRAPWRPRATSRSRATTSSPPRRSPAGSPSSRRSTSRRSTPTSARTRTAPRSSAASRTLRGDEPWAGYDELTAAEVQAVLAEGDDDRARQVRSYERSHKNRAGVLKAAERDLATA